MKRLSVCRGGRELASGPLDQPLIAVGRSPACDVILRAPGVSPMHFLIDWIGVGAFDANEGDWIVSDASGSSQDDSSALKAQGAGLALSKTAVSFGGFEFAIVEDRLQETALEPGILRETLEREGLASVDRERAAGSLEIVRVQSDAQAVIGVVHAPRAEDGRIRLRGSAGAYLEWRERDAIVVWPEAAEVEAYNRGRRVDPEPGLADRASSRTLWLRAGDFVKLKLPTEEIFLRFVAPVSTDPIPQSILKDRLVRWLIGAIALASVLAIFGARKGASQRVMTFEEPRLARVELRDNIVTAPVPTPVPTPRPLPTPAPVPQSTPSPTKRIAAVRPRPSAPSAPLTAGPRALTPQPRAAGPSAGASAAPRAKNERPAAAPAQARSSAVRPSAAPPSAPSTDDVALSMLAGLKGASEVRVTSDSLEKASGTESSSGGAGGGTNPNPRARVSVDEGGDVGGVDLSKASRGVGTGGGAGAPSLASGLGKGEGAGRFSLGGGQGGTALRMEFGGTGARVSGGLSRDVVRESVARRRPSFRACIEAAGLPRSERPRSIAFDIQIDAKGGVTSVRLASSDFASASFEGCMSRALKATSFPAAANGHETSVYYPFLFKG